MKSFLIHSALSFCLFQMVCFIAAVFAMDVFEYERIPNQPYWSYKTRIVLSESVCSFNRPLDYLTPGVCLGGKVKLWFITPFGEK